MALRPAHDARSDLVALTQRALMEASAARACSLVPDDLVAQHFLLLQCCRALSRGLVRALAVSRPKSSTTESISHGSQRGKSVLSCPGRSRRAASSSRSCGPECHAATRSLRASCAVISTLVRGDDRESRKASSRMCFIGSIMNHGMACRPFVVSLPRGSLCLLYSRLHCKDFR
jgi:hypothetical protein